MSVSGNVCAIEKPQTDHREYLPVTLENGLRAIVISDSKCDKAAAALSVKVGSLFDPRGCQGLAHFLEHMLFLGTEKYPQEDEYNAFLAKHGGSSNAYTAEAVTCYYFGVSPEHLTDALDRFCQFFIAPLFTESATDREMQAVDSEHAKNRQSDGWRDRQLLKDDANPKHPFNSFNTGSMETLKVIPERDGFPVRQRLLEFHEEHYSSNVMCLAVLGKESLSELVEIVRSKFGQVVNKKITVPKGPDVGKGEPTFVFDEFPRLVRSIPVKDVRSATFQFMMPQQTPMRWRTKPAGYLSFCIGHEGKGSLLSCLKAKGIATELCAGPVMDEAGTCVFEIRINLTEQGESMVKEIGECVFTYIRLLQQLPVSEELFFEGQRIGEMNFRFRSVGNPVSTVSSLAHMMQDELPIEKVLSGPSKIWDLDRDQIAEVANYMTCSRLRLALTAKSFTEEDCPSTERWYEVRFGGGPLPAEWRDCWEACRTGAGGSQSATAAAEAIGLALPLPNPLVAEDLELRPRPEGGVPKYPKRVDPLPPTLARSLVSACAKVADTPGRVLQVYFRQDDKFDLPKAQLSVDLYCPWAFESLRNRVLTAIWGSAVIEELNEYAYDAEVAGLFYNIGSGSRGLTLTFAGYQDKLPILFRKVTEKMAAADDISEHTWTIVRTVMLRDAANAATTKQPYLQAREWEQRCILKTAVASTEWLECLRTISREDLKGVSKKLLRSCYAEALLQGNVVEEPGLCHVMEALLPALQPEEPPAELPALGVGELPGGPGSLVLIRRVGTNPKEQNGGVVVTLQAADETLENVTLAELTAQVLSQRCFDELRTKQQLGYIVSLSACADCLGTGFCGIRVIVQSEKHPAEVHRRIDSWLASALAELAGGSTDEQLSEYVEALLAQKREKPKRLADEFERNRAQLNSRRFHFTRRDEVIAFLERPKADILPELRAFVRERLEKAPRIAVEVLGATAAASADAEEAKPYEGATDVLETLEEVEAFRQRLSWRLSNTKIEP